MRLFSRNGGFARPTSRRRFSYEAEVVVRGDTRFEPLLGVARGARAALSWSSRRRVESEVAVVRDEDADADVEVGSFFEVRAGGDRWLWRELDELSWRLGKRSRRGDRSRRDERSRRGERSRRDERSRRGE